MKMPSAATFAAAIALLATSTASCAGAVAPEESGQPLISVLQAEQVVAIEEPDECGEVNECVIDFVAGGTGYNLSCGAVRPEVISDDVVAAGTRDGQEIELRRIVGVDPDILVAISLDGGQCGEGEPVLSPWSMAFVENGERKVSVADAVCAAAVEEHLERSGCL